MSYDQAVSQMYALGHELSQTPAHKFDLAHIRVLLSALGHPEKRFPSVLVAGTNGKGSTAASLASILQASGLRTGLYTSPHLVRINERIRLNGQSIADDDFAMLHEVVDRTAQRLVGEGDLPWHPSFFEMLTAMAFEYFAQNHPDIVVFEVGMGGRLDATNVVDPRLSITLVQPSLKSPARRLESSAPTVLSSPCLSRPKPTTSSVMQSSISAREP